MSESDADVPVQSNRDERGRLQPGNQVGFQKGKSGNPGGQPKQIKEIVELARGHAPKAISRLVHLAQHAKEERVQLEACRLLLERGYGKTIQPMAFGDEGAFGNGGARILRIEQVILREQEGEQPIVEGVDFFEVPSTDPEIEARVQRDSAALLVNEIHCEGD
jgi:hypothetical protein